MNLTLKTGEDKSELAIKRIGSSKYVVQREGEDYEVFFTKNGVYIDGKHYFFKTHTDDSGTTDSITLDGEFFPVDVIKIDDVKTNKNYVLPDAKNIKAVLAGKIISVNVELGQRVKKGELLLVLEAMKMENELRSPFTGTVEAINIETGSLVIKDEVLIELKQDK